jgi:hypothetical protein
MNEKYNEMKDHYDFSVAEQGKFYRPEGDLKIPIYLDSDIQDFFSQKALEKHTKPEKLINEVLKKFIKEAS